MGTESNTGMEATVHGVIPLWKYCLAQKNNQCFALTQTLYILSHYQMCSTKIITNARTRSSWRKVSWKNCGATKPLSITCYLVRRLVESGWQVA
jgi:hypothetical protein